MSVPAEPMLPATPPEPDAGFARLIDGAAHACARAADGLAARWRVDRARKGARSSHGVAARDTHRIRAVAGQHAAGEADQEHWQHVTNTKAPSHRKPTLNPCHALTVAHFQLSATAFTNILVRKTSRSVRKFENFGRS